MSNSSLVTYTKLSPNCYKPRKYPISRFTIHHMAWVQCTSKKCADSFANSARQASATYCIGYDGDIAQCVDEKNAPWTSSSYDNDNRAITFEVANSTGGPNWEVSHKSYKALINLMVDCCKRNGKTKVIWLGDKEKSLAYKPKSNEMLMTVHRWFSATTCPGPYLYSKMDDIAKEVNARLQKVSEPIQSTPKTTTTKSDPTDKQIWDFLKAKGLNNYAVAGIMGNLKAESNLRPNNLQNSFEKKLGYTDISYTQVVDSGRYTKFTTDGAGYGLAQWTYHTRKAALLEFAKSRKTSIADLEMQLEFLWKEMQNYTGMMNVLRDAHDVLTASNVFLFSFERPADQGESVQAKRAGFGKEFYAKFVNHKSDEKIYEIQVGAFRSEANAKKRVDYLNKLGIKSAYVFIDNSNMYKVRTMPVKTEGEADRLLAKLKNAGFDDAYII